jgi:hypothetical protein
MQLAINYGRMHGGADGTTLNDHCINGHGLNGRQTNTGTYGEGRLHPP